MFKNIWMNRKVIKQLASNDFHNKFAGSYLGIFWAFIQPVINVTIYWIIFEGGLKAGPESDVPFLLWLIAGICPWFYLNDALNSSTNSLVEYSYIVKKVKFDINVIPIIKIISSTKVHIFFIIVVTAIFILYKFTLTLYAVQCIYYSFCAFILIVGLSYFNTAINVFFRDISQIVSIILQYSMWTVPIMISEDKFPIILQRILKFNPLYYIVQGYRDSFIDHVWFWHRPIITIYFWIVVAAVFVLGIAIFKKLKPYFADVL